MSDKVPSLKPLEASLSTFTKESLKSKDARYELLNDLRSALIFVRDFDKPPPDIIQKENDCYYNFSRPIQVVTSHVLKWPNIHPR